VCHIYILITVLGLLSPPLHLLLPPPPPPLPSLQVALDSRWARKDMVHRQMTPLKAFVTKFKKAEGGDGAAL
jgi:hypothetical protein